MTSTLRQADIPTLIGALNPITLQVRNHFGPLTPAQLNWKPQPSEWSIGQCIDHLIVSNTSYFATFQQILEGKQQPTFWERLPGLPAVWGNFFIKILDPDNQRHVPAPKVFLPTSSDVRPEILTVFASQQEQLIAFMQASQTLPLERIIITSPAAVFVTYSLLAAFRILVIHEQRHLRQMEQVQGMAAFPAGEGDKMTR